MIWDITVTCGYSIIYPFIDSTALSSRKADFPTKNSPVQWGFDEFPQPRKQLAEQNVGRTNFQGVIARRRALALRRWAGRGYLSTMVIFHSKLSNYQRVYLHRFPCVLAKSSFSMEIHHFYGYSCKYVRFIQNEVIYTVAFFAYHYCRLPDGSHHLVEAICGKRRVFIFESLTKLWTCPSFS